MKPFRISTLVVGCFLLVAPATFAQTEKTLPQHDTSPKFVVVIDAGHGGADTGLNTNGVAEKDLDLALALKLRGELEKDKIKVVLTRTKDETMSLSSRVQVVNKTQPDCFISIHSDNDAQKKLFVVRYYNSSSWLLAFNTQLALSNDFLPAATKFKGLPREIVIAPFYVLRKSASPSMMVTVNRTMFSTSPQQQKLAKSLASGIRFYSLNRGTLQESQLRRAFEKRATRLK